MSEFDKKQIFENTCREHIDAIMSACKKHDIPFFLCAAVSDDGKKTGYVNECTTASINHLELSDDQISRHVLITKGFKLRVNNDTETYAYEDEETYEDLYEED